MNDIRARLLTGFLFALLIGSMYLGIHIGAHLTPTGHDYSWNIFALAGDLLLRNAPWPKAATAAVVVLGVVSVALFVTVMILLRQGGRRRPSSAVTMFMARSRDVKILRKRSRTRETEQLHPGMDIVCGLAIGDLLGTRKLLYQGWRETGIYVFGTGRGKTTGHVIPHMLAAPGAAALTSIKVDGVKESLAGRRHLGGQEWVFDPNKIYRRDPLPDFIFPFLKYIHTPEEAKDVAAIFEASTKKITDRGGDPQFDGPGRDMLAYFFLAAALEGKEAGQVYSWIARTQGSVVEEILTRHGLAGPAATIHGILDWPDRTKGSVYATAQRMASALASDSLLAWTVPTPGIREFDPAAFHSSHDTLILLSKEGEGSGGAILTTLIQAICNQAEHAAQRNGGRLPVPVVMELDECANIVRWPELPRVYSFYGSLGIIINSYFQSRAQGIETFGQHGWEALWGAAANRVFGGGIADDAFLESLSRLIGERDEQILNTSTGRDGLGSTSTSTRRARIMDINQLGSLPEWQVVIFNSKCRPTLARTVPWFRNQHLTALITAPDPEPVPIDSSLPTAKAA